MISLEQVRALEDRVERAVSYIAKLREEGADLGRRLAEAQSFIDEAATELAAAEAKLSASETQIEEAVEKALAADMRAEAAEARLDASESKAAEAVATRIREFESRIADMAERVAAAETRAAELSARAEEYRRDQAKIEEGIVHALQKLDTFEDLVLSQAASSPESATQAAREPAVEASGIAVKAAPNAEVETVENELDIF